MMMNVCDVEKRMSSLWLCLPLYFGAKSPNIAYVTISMASKVIALPENDPQEWP